MVCNILSALSEHQQSQYIELLIQFEPQLVFTYLSTSDGYNLDKCLDLCQTHGILDATAYLLEKHGDIAGAMDLSISSIDEKVCISIYFSSFMLFRVEC